MFKFIRKWYFKLYHLFRFLGIIVLIFGIQKNVYAEEYNTCFDEYKIGNVTIIDYQQYFKRIKPSLIVEANNTYYIRFFSDEKYTCNESNNTCFANTGLAWDKDSQGIQVQGIKQSFDKENQILELKIPNIENIHYYGLLIYTWQTNYTVLSNATMIMSKNREDVLSCSTPPEPPTPENNVYSNFLTLYTDRLNYLAGGTTNNPYLIAMIGIIFAWVVLELFLKIFHLRGGYHK